MSNIIQVGLLVVPIVVILLGTLPSYLSAIRQRGLLGVAVLLVLASYVLCVEALAAKTGLPYGKLIYDSSVGFKFFSLVPVMALILYPAILLTSFWIGSKFTHSPSRTFLAAGFATLIHSTLAPALVKLEFMQWEPIGLFYGVSLLAFIGWFLIALIAASILHMLWKPEFSVNHRLTHSTLVLLLFLTGVNVGVQQWVPALIAATLSGLMIVFATIETLKNSLDP